MATDAITWKISCPANCSRDTTGGLALVCDPQPCPRPAEHIQVWTDHGTTNARKLLLHRTALAYAVTEEQAWMIERRRQDLQYSQPLLVK